MKKKKVIVVAVVFVFIWATMFITDLVRAHDFERPMFCVLMNGADDGGSGTYVGFGYTIDIEGNFVTEDMNERGVTEFDMKLFGLRVLAGIRD